MKGAGRALVLATLAFAVNFWAWNLLAPLAPDYQELLDLSAVGVSVLVAVPVLMGSLGRIPVGALTDRFGGRLVLAGLSLMVIPSLLFLSVTTAYPALLAGAFVLGISGASFAAGVPFVNAWFPPERRGFALGAYGMGNVGSSISGFVSPRIVDVAGRPWAFLIVASALLLMAIAMLAAGRESPGRTVSAEPFLARFRSALRMPLARDLALLYAITFGGFVAFAVYLPTYLRTAYQLESADAAARAGGFIVLATLARPAGGWLADRATGVPVLIWSLVAVALASIVAAFQPPMVLATVASLSIAVALGLGNGAVFQLVGSRIEPARVGSVTGIVGAAGGLGGFLPPIVMGLVLEATGSYAIGLMLLSDVALAGAVYAAWRLRPGATRDAIQRS